MYEMKMKFAVSAVLQFLEINFRRYNDSRAALMAAYQQAADKYQEEYREYSKKIVEGTLTEEDKRPIEPRVPIDKSKTYKNYISMFTRNNDIEVELNYSDYCMLVLDQWDFIKEHISAITMYAHSTTTSSTTSASLGAFADSYENGGDFNHWNK